MVEKQSIINLSSFSSKSYASVVLSDSKVTFIGEVEDATFCLILNCILIIDSIP